MAKHESSSSEEGVMERFIGAISPPKLENAGLEDCALPPESIIEAFARAAVSLKSRIAFPFSGDDGSCVHGAGEMVPPMGPVCGGGLKEAEREGAEDDVVVIGAGGGKLDGDSVVIVGGSGEEEEGRESDFGGKRGCIVDGDVVPGAENGDRLDGDLDDDEESEDGPILVGGFI